MLPPAVAPRLGGRQLGHPPGRVTWSLPWVLMVIVQGMSTIRLRSMSLDCADHRALATFSAESVGRCDRLHDRRGWRHQAGPSLVDRDESGELRPADLAAGSVPKQEPIDLDVDDLHEAERRAICLGAVRAPTQLEPESCIVLLDPAGHPFCLTTRSPITSSRPIDRRGPAAPGAPQLRDRCLGRP